MIRKIKMQNQEGFTLIELMIVIAIIGILAAIAIPNFIAYRNKSYCSAAETDTNNLAAALSNYYAIPDHTAVETTLTVLKFINSAQATSAISGATTDQITIVTTDNSGRCPLEYRKSVDGWSTTGPITFTKVM